MLELKGITKSYEGKSLLSGISFTVHLKETVCLLGASGSGKSTLLRIIGGLETMESGDVIWDGRSLGNVPAHERNFGLVFQDYALFQHLDVAGNIAFGLKMKQMNKGEIKKRVDDLLERVNLPGFGPRRVIELSGGEQQRVALARALAPNPRLLMFDEPLGALDRSLKDSLLGELRQILHSQGVPAIYVTHDQEEAFTIADRVMLLHDGCIHQEGTPQELFLHPASAWAAKFLGTGNIVPGVIQGSQVITSLGALPLQCNHAHRQGETVQLLLSSRKIIEDAKGDLTAVVRDVIFQQEGFFTTMENGIFFILPKETKPGEVLRFTVARDSLRCLS